jgi:hypothetical protein
VVVVAGWLAVSFLAAGRARSICTWIATSAFYAVLVAFFGSLTLEAWRDGRRAGWIGFGVLFCLFAGGLGVAGVRTVLQLLRRPGSGRADVIP